RRSRCPVWSPGARCARHPIWAGTPAGVGPLHVGDEVAVTIEGIGTLTNKVIKRG
ncbi:fumarylacetoacetate hydrolase family protein, partial [Streptomyces sp. NPDC001274]